MRLIAEKLSATRNGVVLWQNINFCLKQGQLLQILGSNGIGKSSFLRAIIGLHKLHEGQIKLALNNRQAEIADYCHYLNITPAMKGLLTVEENLLLWQNLLHGTTERYDSIIDKLELYSLKHYRFGELSAGQQRRVALARLWLAPRPVWILDEPFLYLDRYYTNLSKQLLHEHLKNGGIIIMASHENEELRDCQYLNLLNYV
ncbi:heme ABC exporter ATP-binding protein CcmA [Bartonella sp. TP]|uniref:heme ABC exporter ATP-binding protein CcmA n=1 Tax=Bartonella sp. TP TaxID=3057550 RepID=UPI0025AFBF81|nr:heme ABC exporter ATP-binding protein CcmA [Bartonella sp. TP]MDN5248624.1 heme ABC exporter ATP-binding protein CcmA [Alphaproteobacteria bacterium]WJW80422.1 heme ABC exporter ATP-binding protein CcmA [Bartonella sp. TP]